MWKRSSWRRLGETERKDMKRGLEGRRCRIWQVEDSTMHLFVCELDCGEEGTGQNA